jgi:hypothetical protein
MPLIYFNWFRTHGKWGCGNMISPSAAEFCMISFVVISITNCGFDEKMQGFSPSLGDMRNLLTMVEQTRKFGHQWFGDIRVLPSMDELGILMRFTHHN